jgi:hypothetical protein
VNEILFAYSDFEQSSGFDNTSSHGGQWSKGYMSAFTLCIPGFHA